MKFTHETGYDKIMMGVNFSGLFQHGVPVYKEWPEALPALLPVMLRQLNCLLYIIEKCVVVMKHAQRFVWW